MNVSGGVEHGWLIHDVPGLVCFTTARKSAWLKLCVGRPMLLKSLHELLIFQTHRPTALSVGHPKSAGTFHYGPSWFSGMVEEQTKRQMSSDRDYSS